MNHSLQKRKMQNRKRMSGIIILIILMISSTITPALGNGTTLTQTVHASEDRIWETFHEMNLAHGYYPVATVIPGDHGDRIMIGGGRTSGTTVTNTYEIFEPDGEGGGSWEEKGDLPGVSGNEY